MEESRVDIAESTSHEGHAGFKKKKKKHDNMKNTFKKNPKQPQNTQQRQSQEAQHKHDWYPKNRTKQMEPKKMHKGIEMGGGASNSLWFCFAFP